MAADLIYERLDVKMIAGAILSLPIDFTKTGLSQTAYIQDEYIQKLKPGVVVCMSSGGFVIPAEAADAKPLGFLVNDAAGYANQNVNARANGLIAVLSGGGNQFVTDNVLDTNIEPGDVLYAGAGGVLTKEKGTNEIPVAISLGQNSATNKAILAQALI